MATRECGFMGEPFPSQKFQKVMAEYLGHSDPDQEELKEFKPEYTQSIAATSSEPVFCAEPKDKPTLSVPPNLEVGDVQFFKIPILAPEIHIPTPPTLEIVPPSQDIRDQFNIAGKTASTGDVIRLGPCPPGFKRVEPEVIPKLSWDELYQEVLTLRAEVERLQNQQRS